ncbi:hypothetical protein COU61_04835 [Candidatus Pacearchaeota archaeon CG10_big_fil_rev_8_21_14_0_10_35_13]|nr:MAG: hypothetical protein COU61_04835 [Candidatus Pacearchaeota archaeon CG10_big_fil_rev_8_21_14_0_10_35_13]
MNKSLKLLAAVVALVVSSCSSTPRYETLNGPKGFYSSNNNGRSFRYYDPFTGQRISARDSDNRDPWDSVTVQGCFGGRTITPADNGYNDFESFIDGAIDSMR